ncbi:hypothetical protein PENSPDRAFT_648487 [Peniophora sp. CONT]|nr:hypothetical protein PENSPDRAFT_648487 [Peniophora sp. CONT]
MYSCRAQTLRWSSEGLDTSAQFTIFVTNIDVEQNPPPNTSSSSTATGNTQISNPTQTVSGALSRSIAYRRQTVGDYGGYGETWLPRINQNLMTIAIGASGWTWPSVNITQGWYVLMANITSPPIQQTSSLFFLANGTMTIPCPAGAHVVASLSSASPTSTPANTAIPGSIPTAVSGTNPAPASSSPASAQKHTLLWAIVGGAAGGLILVVGALGAIFLMRRRWRHAAAFSARTSYLEHPDASTIVLDPYTATSEQFPALLRFRSSPNGQIEKQLRQQGQIGTEVGGQDVVEPPLPPGGPAQLEVQYEDQMEEEMAGMVSVSARALQRLLRRVGGAISDLQYSEDAGDAASSTAPPEYEDVVGA